MSILYVPLELEVAGGGDRGLVDVHSSHSPLKWYLFHGFDVCMWLLTENAKEEEYRIKYVVSANLQEINSTVNTWPGL